MESQGIDQGRDQGVDPCRMDHQVMVLGFLAHSDLDGELFRRHKNFVAVRYLLETLIE